MALPGIDDCPPTTAKHLAEAEVTSLTMQSNRVWIYTRFQKWVAAGEKLALQDQNSE
jgi:hypothetical protein